ncbi:pentapeptide repeat-containing protein [Streptomyces sp. NPDC001070]
MSPAEPPVPLTPSWPHCGHNATPLADPIGCRGIHVPGHAACLAHLSDTDRNAYFAGLVPGTDIDHRGTPFSDSLLSSLLNALRDPATGNPHLGTARFDGAQFSEEARFGPARFSGTVRFNRARFAGAAYFIGTRFGDIATFDEAQFSDAAWFLGAQFDSAWFTRTRFGDTARFDEAKFGSAWFPGAQFSGETWFVRVQFPDAARFDGAQFSDRVRFRGVHFAGDAGFGGTRFGSAEFGGVQFSGAAEFDGAYFSDAAWFNDARFVAASSFGPMVSSNKIELSGAVFEVPVTLEIAAPEVRCVRTRWESTATVRLRYATADLSHAVLASPIAVTAHPTPFTTTRDAVDEDLLAGRSVGVRLSSIQGADAANLVLTDTDLTDCLFSGAFHLDQLRLEGRCGFAPAPTGWHRRGMWPIRWTRRRTLAEEHHWRAQTAGQSTLLPPGARQWRPGPHHPDPQLTPDPEDVAALYRQLRKAFEDGKNEPGAADFYYGEMEMRRNDRTSTPSGERRLLWGYWLLSGYGLRSSRAFTWLLAAMSLTVLLLMGFGLPSHDPDPATTGTVHGSKIALNTATPDPTLDGGLRQRMSWARAEKATRVAVNSVIFRSTGQNLTIAGTYVEMASRLLEPTLLALGALAIRGRIKR